MKEWYDLYLEEIELKKGTYSLCNFENSIVFFKDNI